MTDIIRYTTPTFTFDPQGEYLVSAITDAVLSLDIDGDEVLTKPFSAATVDTTTNTVTWTLTQAETASLPEGANGFMTAVIKVGSWRGESNPLFIIVRPTSYNQEM